MKTRLKIGTPSTMILVDAIMGGTSPRYEEMKSFESRNLGHFIGGFSDTWHWHGRELAGLSHGELTHIYTTLKGTKE